MSSNNKTKWRIGTKEEYQIRRIIVRSILMESSINIVFPRGDESSV